MSVDCSRAGAVTNLSAKAKDGRAVAAISEGLRHEVGDRIRTTVIMPGAIDTELKSGTSDPASRKFVNAFYEQAIPAESIARAIAYAIEQPENVDVNQIVVRPTAQEF